MSRYLSAFNLSTMFCIARVDIFDEEDVDVDDDLSFLLGWVPVKT